MVMRRIARATKAGFKDFFAFGSRGKVTGYLADFAEADGPVTRAKTVALLGLFAAYKGTPVSLLRDVVHAVESGVDVYKFRVAVDGSVGDVAEEIETLLIQTGMSVDSAKAVARLVENDSYSSQHTAYMGPQDKAAFNELVHKLHGETREMVQF